MDIGEAIQAVREGHKVRREGWSQENFLFSPRMNPEAIEAYPDLESSEVACYWGFLEGEFHYEDIGIWHPDLEDVLTDDWTIIS